MVGIKIQMMQIMIQYSTTTQNHICLIQTGTRTASAQSVLPLCDAQALAVLLSWPKAPDFHRCLSCSATHYRTHLASKYDLPYGFTWRGDIADVRAGADIKQAHPTVVPACD